MFYSTFSAELKGYIKIIQQTKNIQYEYGSKLIKTNIQMSIGRPEIAEFENDNKNIRVSVIWIFWEGPTNIMTGF